MRHTLRQHGQKGQAAVLLALAMVGLLAIVGLALDGGMLYWNQRRAQNGADAAAIAGTTGLVDHFVDTGDRCGGSEQTILNMIYDFATVNEIPGAGTGNVRAYYLTQDGSGNRVLLMNGGVPWEILGGTATVPCGQNIVGIQVVARFPQDTFLAGIIGIVETNVTVEASAVWTFSNWCTDFVIYAINQDRKKFVLSITGADIGIYGGGIHSNGGEQIGGGGQNIDFDDDVPVEYGVDGDVAINPDKISDPDPVIGPVPYQALPKDFFFQWGDFAPDSGVFWVQAGLNGVPRWDFRGRDIRTQDVKDADGKLINGLYITDGSIDLNNLGNLGATDPIWKATLVAMGPISVSGGINQEPAVANVFAFSTYDGRKSGGITGSAVTLSGSDNSFSGMIVAPYGRIDLSASRNSDFSGQIIGWEVDIAGANNHFYHQAGYCPFNPPDVLLVQ